MSDSEQEISEPIKNKSSSAWKRRVLLSVFLLIAISFSFRSVRKEICHLTGGLCYFTCTQYEITEMGCALGEHEVRARFFVRLFGLEKEIDITKGTVITKDGIYRDGVFLGTFKNGVLIKPLQSEPTQEKTQEPQIDER